MRTRVPQRNDIGVIRPGNRGELTVLDAPSYLRLSYRAGVPIARVLDPGRVLAPRS
jgi:imidazolonepropionase